MKQKEEFQRNLEEKEKARLEDTNLKFASELENARKENQFLTAKVEELRAIVSLQIVKKILQWCKTLSNYKCLKIN